MTAPIKKLFTGASKAPFSHSGKPSTLTIRLKPDERLWLEQRAGKHSLSAYARRKLFGKSKRKVAVQPKADHIALAQLLAKLGQSSLAQSMAVLALAARNGNLPILEETEEALQQSCEDIAEMKSLLMAGLGIEEE
ncbi:hypothetical protein [Ponticaulis sp.]|uniref:hypothetical protein n=1 Tax=Ponticaulis sp. TaxID=2020902 RepID=UPI000B733A66|nr:hypothetical protein [Ponticaulis sp.]MAJ09240.1 hypothetical protein [Ponticaulis sp.]HBH91316.1 hypothetical protein [Hyphomonadaceae bacterium]HBJ91324.1 hypothetical protein [Hyphomonadaceae bacterium]|tara:strand:+ start:22335 stop:22742 length:408 start_codon:yes stop_codon:yes gene_type:complete